VGENRLPERGKKTSGPLVNWAVLATFSFGIRGKTTLPIEAKASLRPNVRGHNLHLKHDAQQDSSWGGGEGREFVATLGAKRYHRFLRQTTLREIAIKGEPGGTSKKTMPETVLQTKCHQRPPDNKKKKGDCMAGVAKRGQIVVSEDHKEINS